MPDVIVEITESPPVEVDVAGVPSLVVSVSGDPVTNVSLAVVPAPEVTVEVVSPVEVVEVGLPVEGGGGVTDHGDLTGLSDDDHPFYHNNARGDARYIRTVNDVGPDGSGNVDVTGGGGVDLEADSRLFADPPTEYPMGFSTMPATSFDAGTFGGEEGGGVVWTERYLDPWASDEPVPSAVQMVIGDIENSKYIYTRRWDVYGEEWLPPEYLAYADGLEFTHDHDHIRPLSAGFNTEAAGPTSYPEGISLLPVSIASTWNGTNGYGLVVTHRKRYTEYGETIEETSQTLYRSSNRTRYERYWDHGLSAWSPWEAFSKEGHTHPELGDKTYTHTQDTPDTVWEYEHGMGKNPAVNTFGTDGYEIEADVTYPVSGVSVRVEFGAVASGIAYNN